MSRCRVGWLKRLLYVFLASLFIGTGLSANASAGKRETVEQAQIYLPVDLTDTQVMWEGCGTWNGYYYHTFNTIVLCWENLREGVEVARFIFLHELGHRFTFLYGSKYDRWHGNYEAAADEFAAVFSIVQGNPEDLLAVAQVYREWAEKYVHDPEDPHPPMTVRAEMMENIYYSYAFGKGDYYVDALRHWRQELIRVKALGV